MDEEDVEGGAKEEEKMEVEVTKEEKQVKRLVKRLNKKVGGAWKNWDFRANSGIFSNDLVAIVFGGNWLFYADFHANWTNF